MMLFDRDNIESHEFNIEKKGYNKTEVKEFLKELSNELEGKLRIISDLEEELEVLKSKLNEYQNMDSQIRDAIIFLQESERDTITKTQNEVSNIVKEAEERRDKIITEAEIEAKATRDTLLFLKEQHEILLKRLKIIVNNQEAMLKEFSKGNDTAHLQKSIAEAAAYRAQVEMNIDEILEKLL